MYFFMDGWGRFFSLPQFGTQFFGLLTVCKALPFCDFKTPKNTHIYTINIEKCACECDPPFVAWFQLKKKKRKRRTKKMPTNNTSSWNANGKIMRIKFWLNLISMQILLVIYFLVSLYLVGGKVKRFEYAHQIGWFTYDVCIWFFMHCVVCILRCDASFVWVMAMMRTIINA